MFHSVSFAFVGITLLLFNPPGTWWSEYDVHESLHSSTRKTLRGPDEVSLMSMKACPQAQGRLWGDLMKWVWCPWKLALKHKEDTEGTWWSECDVHESLPSSTRKTLGGPDEVSVMSMKACHQAQGRLWGDLMKWVWCPWKLALKHKEDTEGTWWSECDVHESLPSSTRKTLGGPDEVSVMSMKACPQAQWRLWGELMKWVWCPWKLALKHKEDSEGTWWSECDVHESLPSSTKKTLGGPDEVTVMSMKACPQAQWRLWGDLMKWVWCPWKLALKHKEDSEGTWWSECDVHESLPSSTRKTLRGPGEVSVMSMKACPQAQGRLWGELMKWVWCPWKLALKHKEDSGGT